MKIELVGNWKQLSRTWSLYGIGLIAALPELWNLAITMGMLDSEVLSQDFSYLVKVVSFGVAAVRIIKQKGLEKYADPTPEEVVA